MKKYFLALLLIPILLLSCEKSDTEVSSEPKVVTEISVPTYNSIHNAMTYKVTNEGSDLQSYENNDIRPALGDKFYIIGEPVSVKSKKDGEAVLELVKCKNDDDETFWLKTDMIVPNGTLAIVKNDDTVIYSKPDKLKPSGDILSKTTIVTVYPEAENGFRLITTWDEIQNVKRANVYIKAEDLSTKDSDIQSFRTYFLATKTSNEVAKKTLFETALEYNNSVFYDLIKAEYKKAFSSSSATVAPASVSQTVLPATSPISFDAVINDNNVNIRNIPVVAGSAIIAQLNPGDTVSIIEETVDTVTIDGISEKWYKISEPEGWVFGSFLDPQ